MFICDYCHEAVGPGIKPVVVVDPNELRRVQYTRMDELGPVITSGTEITKEYKKCPSCAGEVLSPVQAEDRTILNLVKALLGNKHASGCKKAINECHSCKTSIEAFKNVPLLTLSLGITQPPAPKIKSPFGGIMFDNALMRTTHNSKRAERDHKASLAFIAMFKQAGGDIEKVW